MSRPLHYSGSDYSYYLPFLYVSDKSDNRNDYIRGNPLSVIQFMLIHDGDIVLIPHLETFELPERFGERIFLAEQQSLRAVHARQVLVGHLQ